MFTPWGESQSVEEIVDGITEVSTRVEMGILRVDNPYPGDAAILQRKALRSNRRVRKLLKLERR